VAATCRRGECRTDALDFIDTARQVTDALVGSVPGAVAR
jgi:hypothetical protein